MKRNKEIGMELHVKILWDEYGTREFIIFEPGKFSTPVAILTEGYAENFFGDFKKAIEKPPHKVRSIEYLSENLKFDKEESPEGYIPPDTEVGGYIPDEE